MAKEEISPAEIGSAPKYVSPISSLTYRTNSLNSANFRSGYRMISFVKVIDGYVLAALIAFELLVCYNFYCREIAWYPPANYDQTIYLMDAYRTKERILTGGFGQLARVIGSRSIHWLGTSDFRCSLWSLLCRWAVPDTIVSFVGFSVLQVGAFLMAQAVWRSRMYGYMLLGLILC